MSSSYIWSESSALILLQGILFSLYTEPYCISKKCSREDIKSLNKIGQDFLYIQHISENEDKLY